MKFVFALLLFFAFTIQSLQAQKKRKKKDKTIVQTETLAGVMDNQKLYSILYTISNEIEGQEGSWQFVIDSTLFICLTDVTHNRMRIIAPITEMDKVSEDELHQCMEANFHTALDIRYAVSDNVLWSAFIHPLKELTKKQVLSAISQVYSGVKTYGTYYSSGTLTFPTKEDRAGKKN